MSPSLMRLSCTKIESRQDQRKLFALRPTSLPRQASLRSSRRSSPHRSDTRRHQREPLSRPTPHRRTSIPTTGLAFSVCFRPEGATEVWVQDGARRHQGRHRSSPQEPSLARASRRASPRTIGHVPAFVSANATPEDYLRPATIWPCFAWPTSTSPRVGS